MSNGDDDGKSYPLTNIDETLTQITNSVRDSILPDVTMFVGYEVNGDGIAGKVFYRLKHIEAYGTGLRRIMQFYDDFEVKPEITATHGAFILTLPNMNYARPLSANRQQKPQYKAVLDYLKENSVITNETVQELLSVKQTRAYAIIKKLAAANLIVKKGLSRGDNEYVLTE